MCTSSPEHYSYRFILKTDKLPAKATDKFPRSLLILGIIFGMLLIMLGALPFLPFKAENLTGLDTVSLSGVLSQNFLSAKIFTLLSILTGIWLIFISLRRFTCRKEIFFDGQNFKVTNHFSGKETSFEEPLYNYKGVRLNVMFYQFGILTKNKFIIELLHQDPAKNIPLYISMRARSIRRLWKEYARFFRMPALKISDKGMVSYNTKSLELPYEENVRSWHLPQNFMANWDKPSYIVLRSRPSGEKLIKIKKVFLDAYNILATAAVLILGSLAVYAVSLRNIILQYMPLWSFIGCLALVALIIIYAVLTLLSSDIILIAKNKIALFHKTLFMRIYRGIIHIPDIKGIDINYIPTLNRYYLAVVSNQETLVFGQKMPVKDLRWLRALLISEIVGN